MTEEKINSPPGAEDSAELELQKLWDALTEDEKAGMDITLNSFDFHERMRASFKIDHFRHYHADLLESYRRKLAYIDKYWEIHKQ